jgi:hypothetical protein
MTMHRLTQLFTDHPGSVDETYFEHMRFAGWFAFWLGAAAFCALVHAILPFAFERTASRIIDKLHSRIHNRAAPAHAVPAE